MKPPWPLPPCHSVSLTLCLCIYVQVARLLLNKWLLNVMNDGLIVYIYFILSGKPADLFNNSHPDWAPSIMMTDEERQPKTDDERSNTTIKR